ncbi:hypothetical protein ACJZ2D_000992 [Fusarium nematophilum]
MHTLPWPNKPPHIRPPSLFHHHAGRFRPLPPPLPFGLVLPPRYSLFEIRLDTDLIILRENAQSEVLRGVLVLCLHSPLRLEEVSLELVGTLCHRWTDAEPLAHKTTVLHHKWPVFTGSRDTSMILPAGNYEWPFEYTIPNDAAETVEGLPEGRISYRLKATITRPKLLPDQHTRRRFRVFRTPSPDTLEMMQSVPIERTWLNKVDYFVNLSAAAVMLGGSVTLEIRLAPLVKGLDWGEFSVSLMQVCECHIENRPLFHRKEYHNERTVFKREFQVSREQDWQDMIEGTGQEGWAITRKLDIPNHLGECVQDVDIHGIQVHHKIKVVMPLKNSDGHMSELAAGLPLVILVDPNMPFDEPPNSGRQVAAPPRVELDAGVPPEYGDHTLDQLFNDDEVLETRGMQQNGAENGDRPTTEDATQPSSSESFDMDSDDMDELNRVPTYRTAVRSPLRFLHQSGNMVLPQDGITTNEYMAPIGPAVEIGWKYGYSYFGLIDCDLDSFQRQTPRTLHIPPTESSPIHWGIKQHACQAEAIYSFPVEHEAEVARASRSVRRWAIFKGTDGRRTITSIWTLMTQQFIGLTLFSTFASYFFQQAGIEDAFQATCITSAISIASGLVIIATADRFGRRLIACGGSTLAWVSCIGVGVLGVVRPTAATNYLLVFFAYLWNMGMTANGATGWGYVGEISSQRLRPYTAGFGAASTGICGVIMNVLTPYMVNANEWGWGLKTGWFYVGVGFPCIAIMWFLIPETKGYASLSYRLFLLCLPRMKDTDKSALGRRTAAELDELFERKVKHWRFHKTDTATELVLKTRTE